MQDEFIMTEIRIFIIMNNTIDLSIFKCNLKPI